MAIRILCAVDDRESSQVAMAVAAQLVNVLGVQLTYPMGQSSEFFDRIVAGSASNHGTARLPLGSVFRDVTSRGQCTVTVAS